MRKLKIVLLALVLLVAIGVLLGVFVPQLRNKPVEENNESPVVPAVLPSELASSEALGKAIEKVEKNKYIDKQIKQQLVEQGYPEEAVDDLLLQGAQRAVPLKNIASVYEQYGSPWNVPLYVGEYELVALYLIGNTDNRFVLGHYEDATGEKVIFLHMSTTVTVKTLQAGLVYSEELPLEQGIAYINSTGDIVGFQFDVELDSGEVARYVATSSGKLTEKDIESFIGSVVDGKVI